MNSEIKIKHCSKCDQDKPIDQFRLKKDQRKGKLPHFYYQYLCIDCQGKRDKKYRVLNRFFLEENKRLKDRSNPFKKQKVKQTREEILKKARDASRIYYYSHIEERKAYYQLNQIAISERRKIKYKEDKKSYRSYPGRRIDYMNAKIPQWRQSEKITGRILLSNQYVKKLIHQSSGLALKNIPPELVENYRMQIKVKRLIKQKKDENTETS